MTNRVIAEVSRYLRIPTSYIERAVLIAPRSYKKYSIPKKSGGRRIILHPSRRTKVLQYAAIELLLRHLPVHDAATAYRRGTSSPLRKNAAAHAKYRYTIRLDFEDFFPSVIPNDLIHRIDRGDKYDSPLSEAEVDAISRILFVEFSERTFLSIGSPASPIVSNIVMYDIDGALVRFAAEHQGCYTRYADDLLFSTNARDDRKAFEEHVRSILDSTSSPRLKVNDSKTRYMSRSRKRVITGLVVTPDGSISIGRSRKRSIRSMIYRMSLQSKVSKKQREKLGGLLGFAWDVDPEYCNRLIVKFGSATLVKVLGSAAFGPAAVKR